MPHKEAFFKGHSHCSEERGLEQGKSRFGELMRVLCGGSLSNCGAFKPRNRRDLETFCDLGGGNDWPWCLVGGGRLWEVAGGSQHLGPSSRVDGDVLDQVGEAWGRTGPGGGAQASCGRVQALWGVLDAGMQKQLLGSGVQGGNCG